MLMLAMLFAGDAPEPEIPPLVSLRNKLVKSSAFRAQAKRISKELPLIAGHSPPHYIEGVIVKTFGGSWQVAVENASGRKFVVAVDNTGMNANRWGVGDSLRVYGVVRAGPKLYAYWCEHWLLGVEITCKAARNLTVADERVVTGVVKNGFEKPIRRLKLAVTLSDPKNDVFRLERIDIGDLEPGADKKFEVKFVLPDASSRKATLADAYVATFERHKPSDAKDQKDEPKKDSKIRPTGDSNGRLPPRKTVRCLPTSN